MANNHRSHPGSTEETEFAVDLFKAVAKGTSATENIVLCPSSAEWLLATLYPGLRGDCGEELSRVLQLSERSLTDLTTKLQSITRSPESVISYRLRIAHGVFADSSTHVRSNYANIVSAALNDLIHTAPFKSDHRTAHQMLVRFVEEGTDGRISDIKNDHYAANSSLILLSAVAFKVQWEDPFRLSMTLDDTFTGADGKKTVMPFMYQCPWNHYYKYGDGTQIVKLKQRGGQGKVMLVLPPEDVPLSVFEQTLTAAALRRMFNEEESYFAGVLLPRFSVEAEVNLAPIMSSLGAGKIFGSEGDLSGISEDKTIGNTAKFIHKAVIDVDEVGAIDTGPTQMGHILSWVFDFRADRPFLFTVWHIESQIPIIMARVANPSPCAR